MPAATANEPLAAEQDEAGDEQQRPDEVELLLHRQRPEVLQQRRPPDRAKYEWLAMIWCQLCSRRAR